MKKQGEFPCLIQASENLCNSRQKSNDAVFVGMTEQALNLEFGKAAHAENLVASGMCLEILTHGFILQWVTGPWRNLSIHFFASHSSLAYTHPPAPPIRNAFYA